MAHYSQRGDPVNSVLHKDKRPILTASLLVIAALTVIAGTITAQLAQPNQTFIPNGTPFPNVGAPRKPTARPPEASI